MFGEKFAHFSAVRTAEQLLHATIHVSSIVVSRYTRLDSFVVKHIALFSLEDESVLFLLLMCIYPLIPRPHQRTQSFNSLVFHSRLFRAPGRPCYISSNNFTSNVSFLCHLCLPVFICIFSNILFTQLLNKSLIASCQFLVSPGFQLVWQLQCLPYVLPRRCLPQRDVRTDGRTDGQCILVAITI